MADLRPPSSAHYGLIHIGGQTLAGLLRNAGALIAFAASVVSR